MGELLLCHEPIAALPYYVEEIGQNLYSMEELSYYIAGNIYLLDASLMNGELCTWVEQQLKRYKLAERLRAILRAGGRLSDFVLAILEDAAYCTPREMQEIVLAIRQMEEKSDFECSKLRADQLMEKEKYLAAIYAYKQLLEAPEAKPGELLGNIWHNLGTAYARLFLFEDAARCFRIAYENNGAGESVREYLLCFLIQDDEDGFCRAAGEYGLDAMGMREIRNELAIAESGDELKAFRERIAALIAKPSGAQRGTQSIIFQWKESYRRSCRV